LHVFHLDFIEWEKSLRLKGATLNTTGALLAIKNPANASLLCEIPKDTCRSLEKKIERARTFSKTWKNTPLIERMAALRRFDELLKRDLEKLAQILTLEMGKPIAQSRDEIRSTHSRTEFFLGEIERALAGEEPSCQDYHNTEMTEIREFLEREPLGVIASISAWNYPYFVGFNVFAPALLTGNCVLYKPSEHAALSGRAMGDLLHEAGIPEQAFQVVVGDGEQGQALVASQVDGIFFTGSSATGKLIAKTAQERMIRLQLELGGKDPVYVCDDADLDFAAYSIAEGIFYNSGQGCSSVERIYIHEAVHEPFIERLQYHSAAWQIGNPLEDTCKVGPLAREEQPAFLMTQVEDAIQKGAFVLRGGKRGRDGYFFEPTLLANCNHSMRLMQEESFGPIAGLASVPNDQAALTLMNDTTYGLTAAVYSRSKERARRILKDVEAATVYWNCCDRVSPRLPWGGRKDSGMGVTLSVEGLRIFTRTKAWHLRDTP
jgi:acyl-CoA reductase-like NAD-dependent aldehyde dehydrogenase